MTLGLYKKAPCARIACVHAGEVYGIAYTSFVMG